MTNLDVLAFISAIDRSAIRCHECIPPSLLVSWHRRYTIMHRARELAQIPDPRANGCQVIHLGFQVSLAVTSHQRAAAEGRACGHGPQVELGLTREFAHGGRKPELRELVGLDHLPIPTRRLCVDRRGASSEHRDARRPPRRPSSTCAACPSRRAG